MDTNKMTYPKVSFKNDKVLFKVLDQITSIELLPDDLATVVKMDNFTFCIIKGYTDDHIRCVIYRNTNIAYDQQYCFPQSHEVLGEHCMDYACHTLAEMFFAAFLAENM